MMTVVLTSRKVLNVRSATVFTKRMKKKKACDRKHYKANSESKKESAKAQYWLDPETKKEWLDPESMKESAKAHYDQNRELIFASKQAQYQANQKAKRDISRINSRRKRNPTR